MLDIFGGFAHPPIKNQMVHPLLEVVTIPHVWLSQVYKNTWEDLELTGTMIEKPGHWMRDQFQKLCKHKSEKYLPASEKRAQIWTAPQYHERSSSTELR